MSRAGIGLAFVWAACAALALSCAGLAGRPPEAAPAAPVQAPPSSEPIAAPTEAADTDLSAPIAPEAVAAAPPAAEAPFPAPEAPPAQEPPAVPIEEEPPHTPVPEPAAGEGPPPEESPPAPAEEAAPAAASAAPAAPSPAAYLETALSLYWVRTLPNGLVLAVKRQPGRRVAAARVVLVPGPYPARLAGLPALALTCAARGRMGARPGAVDAALYAAGASLEIRVDDFDDVALELECPLPSLAPLLKAIGNSLIGPAFRPEDFQRAMSDFRLALRRESGDELARAAAALRAAAYAGHPYAIPPRGTAASLAALRREDVLRFWADGAGAERIRIAVAGDVDPEALAAELEPVLSLIPRRDPEPVRQEALPLRALALSEPFPAASGRAVVRAELGAPRPGEPDHAALAVALAMVDAMLAAALRSASPPLAYASWTRLSSAAAGSASLVVQGCVDPPAAKAAFESAAAELASGRCLAADGSGAMADIESSLASYKLRAVSRAYSRADGTAAIAARVARDLAAGGDGTAFFREASRIEAVLASDVARVARERLVEGPSAWIALGDPALVAGFGQPPAAP